MITGSGLLPSMVQWFSIIIIKKLFFTFLYFYSFKTFFILYYFLIILITRNISLTMEKLYKKPKLFKYRRSNQENLFKIWKALTQKGNILRNVSVSDILYEKTYSGEKFFFIRAFSLLVYTYLNLKSNIIFCIYVFGKIYFYLIDFYGKVYLMFYLILSENFQIKLIHILWVVQSFSTAFYCKGQLFFS